MDWWGVGGRKGATGELQSRDGKEDLVFRCSKGHGMLATGASRRGPGSRTSRVDPSKFDVYCLFVSFETCCLACLYALPSPSIFRDAPRRHGGNEGRGVVGAEKGSRGNAPCRYALDVDIWQCQVW